MRRTGLSRGLFSGSWFFLFLLHFLRYFLQFWHLFLRRARLLNDWRHIKSDTVIRVCVIVFIRVLLRFYFLLLFLHGLFIGDFFLDIVRVIIIFVVWRSPLEVNLTVHICSAEPIACCTWCEVEIWWLDSLRLISEIWPLTTIIDLVYIVARVVLVKKGWGSIINWWSWRLWPGKRSLWRMGRPNWLQMRLIYTALRRRSWHHTSFVCTGIRIFYNFDSTVLRSRAADSCCMKRSRLLDQARVRILATNRSWCAYTN